MYADEQREFPNKRPQSGQPFVESVRAQSKRPRNRTVERLLVGGWILIAVKSLAVWWACAHYAVPFSAWWIIAPTVAFAVLCTVVYACRTR